MCSTFLKCIPTYSRIFLSISLVNIGRLVNIEILCACLSCGYCSTVQALLDWFEVDLGFTELSFIQIGLCVLCVFVLYSRVSLSACPFLDILHCFLALTSSFTRTHTLSLTHTHSLFLSLSARDLFSTWRR